MPRHSNMKNMEGMHIVARAIDNDIFLQFRDENYNCYLQLYGRLCVARS